MAFIIGNERGNKNKSFFEIKTPTYWVEETNKSDKIVICCEIEIKAKENLGKVKITYGDTSKYLIVRDFDDGGYDGEITDVLEKNSVAHIKAWVMLLNTTQKTHWFVLNINFDDENNQRHSETQTIFISYPPEKINVWVYLIVIMVLIIIATVVVAVWKKRTKI